MNLGGKNGSSGGSSGGSSVIIIGPNGSRYTMTSISELITIAAAASSDSVANLLPANSFIMAVTYRVTTLIPTAANFDIGIAGDTTLFGTGILVAANTVGNMFSSVGLGPFYNATATKIRITPNMSPASATGRVRCVVFYGAITDPTS